MDYSILAAELLDNMQALRRAKPHRNMGDAMQGEAFVLHYLDNHSGEAMPSEIGSDMNVSSARIAQTLNSIEKKGWITRQIDTDDRRRILVRLTPEGKNETEKLRQTAIGLATKILRLLDEEDAMEYVRLTGKLSERILANNGIF